MACYEINRLFSVHFFISIFLLVIFSLCKCNENSSWNFSIKYQPKPARNIHISFSKSLTKTFSKCLKYSKTIEFHLNGRLNKDPSNSSNKYKSSL